MSEVETASSFTVEAGNTAIEISILHDNVSRMYAFKEDSVGLSMGFRKRVEAEKALIPWLASLAKAYNLSEEEVFRVQARCLLAASNLILDDSGKVKPLGEPIQVGEVKIIPLANSYTPVHPAIGVVDDTAYVGVWIPSQKRMVKKDGEEEKVKVVNMMYLCTEHGELILCDNDVLVQHGWMLEYMPVESKSGWSKAVDYVKGDREADPVQVLEQVMKEYETFIEFSDEREYFLHILWDVGTYFHHLFNSYPYLYIGGIKRCGKSKLLTLHSLLAFNAFFSSNMSVSSIYRLIQNTRGTLLIDETEKLSNPDRAQEFRSILLSGYKKGAVVYRVEKAHGETLVPEAFEVFGPKALANIQGVEDVLEDRCIVTIMKRGKNKKVTDSEINVHSEHYSELRHRLHILYLRFWREVKEIYDKISEHSELSELVNILNMDPSNNAILYNRAVEHLTARELELWRPIFAIAKFFDNHIRGKDNVLNRFASSPSTLCSLMFELAVEKAGQKHLENVTETGEVILVQVLMKLYEYDGYYRVKDIVEAMSGQFDEEQKWLNTRWVGNALKRLGFTEKRRVGTGYEYRVTKAMLDDLAERLGISEHSELSEHSGRTCKECLYHRGTECMIHRSWTTVMPTHPACEKFTEK
jgi:hypothetical protein